MGISAAQATAFYEEAVREGSVWAVRDGDGFPAPLSPEGRRAMPFWSLRSRAEKVIATVPDYGAFVPVELSLGVFLSRWLPGLERDDIRVGVNWSGTAATGYDLAAREVALNLAALGRSSTRS
ncbi:DUF2750 domain-containing protein [Cellulomonas composti]|uniref:DUF2750 domain-containing protein n=1 Tax=Cellulomonas composti TaxID=266130 RepID=A0A511JC55_9CELL|nr:DUF2750 domain-containing protein [Cellulomonas composti]GEL95558.1 hypothetical protein CCO02nite_22160 [Cellulomonas composti]